ncbi:hypothetical protein Tco_0236223 [Tanacetum coccineum]
MKKITRPRSGLSGNANDIPNQCESEQAFNSLHIHSKDKYIVYSYRGRTHRLFAKKKDISENRASRNFNLMIIKWRLLKITLQAPFLNVQKTFDRNRSSLGLHGNDVCSQHVVFKGPRLHQMNSDHNRSELDSRPQQ